MQNLESLSNPEGRLARLEKVLNFDNRIKAIEEGYGARKASQPWWQSATIVTLLTATIALIIPAVTAIEAHFKNKGETERLLIAQSHSIRQTYLDRVLKPGLTDIEKYNIFRLLVRLKEDSVIYGWAQENLAETTKKLFNIKKEDDLKLSAMAKRIDSLRTRAALAVGAERKARDNAIRTLQGAYVKLQQQQRDIVSIVEPANTITRDYCVVTMSWEDLKPVPGVTVSIFRHGVIEPPKFATTDSEGKACLPVIVGKSYAVSAFKQGYLPNIIYAEPSSPTTTTKSFRMQLIK
jgi:hypothetical protein